MYKGDASCLPKTAESRLGVELNCVELQSGPELTRLAMLNACKKLLPHASTAFNTLILHTLQIFLSGIAYVLKTTVDG